MNPATLYPLIGQKNTYYVRRFTPNGAYVGTDPDGSDGIEILLPRREVPDQLQVGDACRLFVYTDSEDRPVATRQQALVQANEVAYLTVKTVNKIGAFFDWGLPKDLLVPFSEQTKRLDIGRRYLIYAYADPATNRMVGTMYLPKFIKNNDLTVAESDAVQLVVAEFHERGLRVVVNHRHWGMVYGNQIFQTIRIGQTLRGYVRLIREDNKLDISLQADGYDASIDHSVERLAAMLKRSGGFVPLTDHSQPEDIYALLQMSKKQFKKAVGLLFKQRLISIEPNGIRHIKQESE